MNLQEKIIAHFEGKVVRKDLSKLVKGNAVVPSYVLEYLLGQHCASFDEEIIQHGVERVKGIVKNHFVHRDEAEVIKHLIRDKGPHRIIDKVTVRLNERKDVYEATFSNLGISRVVIDGGTIKKHPKLLTGGVWCIVNMGYLHTEERDVSPWIIEQLKPIQISNIDIEEYKEIRKEFTKEEWIDLLLQSMGLNPTYFSFRDKKIQLTRLVPFCENNYNFIELGPKGTGKSHLFSELSPHGILLSGGDVTQAKLFVNNASGNIGLVGYWDTVAFDEFAGSTKRVNRQLVDIMKNYMANKTFSRGRDVYGASASFAFVGNTEHSVAYMLKHTNLFEALPKTYYDTAFLDRIHAYLPGWEVKKLRTEMFTDDYGFIVDYLAEVMREMRKEDYSNLYQSKFKISANLTTRDRTAVHKTFSGLAKIIYPHGDCTTAEIEELLAFALECRKRVNDQLYKMDETFESIDFQYYTLPTNKVTTVTTLEMKQYGTFETAAIDVLLTPTKSDKATPSTPEPELEAGKHLLIHENEMDITYKGLFAPYLKGAMFIHLHDPYLRLFYQVKNLMEFCTMVFEQIPVGEEVTIDIVTQYDIGRQEKSEAFLDKVVEAFDGTSLTVRYEFNQSPSFHARSIETDTGWKITMDRGLDIYLKYEMNDVFSLENRLQGQRKCRGIEVSYLRI